MSRSYETPAESRNRTNARNRSNAFRDDQRYVEAPSSDLSGSNLLRYIRPLGRGAVVTSLQSSDISRGKVYGIPQHGRIDEAVSTPIVVIIGDGATLSDSQLYTSERLYLDGVLRAASTSGALVVDSGLASSISSAPGPHWPNRRDYCRNVQQLGVSPAAIEESLSKYHTHHIVMDDFQGWQDRQDEFVRHKVCAIFITQKPVVFSPRCLHSHNIFYLHSHNIFPCPPPCFPTSTV